MNRETSIHSSDTLVVVDRSRQRRRLLIAAAAGVVLLVIVLAVVFGRGAKHQRGENCIFHWKAPFITKAQRSPPRHGCFLNAFEGLG